MLGNLWSFEDKHKGETCYIFGDGKSLKYYDFSSFSDLPSISLGLASLHVGSKFLNLKYSLICDSFSLWPGRNIYDYIMRTVVESIKSKEYLRALSYISPYKLFGLICNKYIIFQVPEPLGEDHPIRIKLIRFHIGIIFYI